MEEFYIPTLHWFAMKNGFAGSHGALRFKITPLVVMSTPKEVDYEQSSIKAELWHGPFCYEKSDIEAERIFPMSKTGRNEMRDWIWENR